jgi:hypothetical protein
MKTQISTHGETNPYERCAGYLGRFIDGLMSDSAILVSSS